MFNFQHHFAADAALEAILLQLCALGQFCTAVAQTFVVGRKREGAYLTRLLTTMIRGFEETMEPALSRRPNGILGFAEEAQAFAAHLRQLAARGCRPAAGSTRRDPKLLADLVEDTTWVCGGIPEEAIPALQQNAARLGFLSKLMFRRTPTSVSRYSMNWRDQSSFALTWRTTAESHSLE